MSEGSDTMIKKIYKILIVLTVLAFVFPYQISWAQTSLYRDDLGDVTGSNSNTVYSALDDALNAIGSNQTTLFINRELTVNSSECVVPSNVSLEFMKGGSINVGAGKNLVINGPIIAPRTSIFTCNDTIIEDCENAWNEQTVTGVTSTVDTSDKQSGNASAKLIVSDNAGIGILASKALSVSNINNATTIYIWLKSNVTTNNNSLNWPDSADLSLVFDDSTNCSSPVLEVSLPQLTSNIWRRVAINLTAEDASKLRGLTSIGIKLRHNIGAFSLWIDDVKTSLGVRIDEGNNTKVYPDWFLPAGYSTDGSVDYSSYVQLAMNSILKGTVDFPAFPIKANINIINRSDYRVTGKGSTIKPFGDLTYAFNLIGTINNLQIDSLSIIGEGNSEYHTVGIGNNSGQTISNVIFSDLDISEVNAGISLTATLGGIYNKAIVTRNKIKNMRGEDSGQGYGINLSNATNCIVSNNILDDCERHSIYQGNGYNSNNVITENIIKNHRMSATTHGGYRCAVVICRSSGIILSNNIITDYYDGGLEISQVNNERQGNGTYQSFYMEDVIVTGNSFINRKNAQYDAIIGEMKIPQAANVSKVLFKDNYFYTDYSIGGPHANITIQNGKQISVTNNMFFRDNVNGTTHFVNVGDDSYISQTDHCTDLNISDNDFIAQGSDTQDVRGIRISYALCRDTNISPNIRVRENYLRNVTAPIEFLKSEDVKRVGEPNNPNTNFEFKVNRAIDFDSIPAKSTADYAVIILGAKPSSLVIVNPLGSIPSGLMVTGFSDPENYNTIYVRVANVTANAIDPPELEFRIKVKDE